MSKKFYTEDGEEELEMAVEKTGQKGGQWESRRKRREDFKKWQIVFIEDF